MSASSISGILSAQGAFFVLELRFSSFQVSNGMSENSAKQNESPLGRLDLSFTMFGDTSLVSPNHRNSG